MATAKTFDLDHYLAQSREASGVPPRIEDRSVLAQVARWFRPGGDDTEEAANGRVS